MKFDRYNLVLHLLVITLQLPKFFFGRNRPFVSVVPKCRQKCRKFRYAEPKLCDIPTIDIIDLLLVTSHLLKSDLFTSKRIYLIPMCIELSTSLNLSLQIHFPDTQDLLVNLLMKVVIFAQRSIWETKRSGAIVCDTPVSKVCTRFQISWRLTNFAVRKIKIQFIDFIHQKLIINDILSFKCWRQ